jgi:hypothetical protein
MERPRLRRFLPLFLFLCVFVLCGYVVRVVTPREASAQTPTPSEIKLPAGQKLEGAGWHCWSGGSCELWYLTRPREAGKAPETHTFSNADGSRKYVLKEQ